jgi:hypothetical protein
VTLVAAGLVLVAAAAFAQTDVAVLAPTVFASHELPSDAITGFTVSCPPGYLAVSAGVTTPGPGSTLLSLRPTGSHAFTFRFGNPAANEATRVRVAVACRTVRGGPVLRLKLVKSRVVVRPGGKQAALLSCPPNTTPAGAGFDLQPGSARSVDGFGGAVLSPRTGVASLRALQFRIASAAGHARVVTVYGNCLTVQLAANVARAQLTTRISTYTNVVSPGQHQFRHRCRSGWTALGTGYDLASGSLRVDGAAAVGTSASWWLGNTSGETRRARLQVICGRVD